MPKEMLPMFDKPLIQYGVEEAHGKPNLHSMGFITGPGKRAQIADSFDTVFLIGNSRFREPSKNSIWKIYVT